MSRHSLLKQLLSNGQSSVFSHPATCGANVGIAGGRGDVGSGRRDVGISPIGGANVEVGPATGVNGWSSTGGFSPMGGIGSGGLSVDMALHSYCGSPVVP